MLEFEDLATWKARQKPKRKAPENAVKMACIYWLQVHRILHNRQQSGNLEVINPVTRKSYRIMLASKGSGDIVGCTKKGRYFELEIKSDSGRQSSEQKAHQHNVEASGGIYIIARSTDDLHGLLLL